MSKSAQVDKQFGSISTGLSAFTAPAAVSNIADGSAMAVTVAQLVGGVISATPTAARNITLPATSAFFTAFPNVKAGDHLDFSVVNLATITADTLTLVAADGSTTTVGVMATAYVAAGQTASGRYRIHVATVVEATPNSYSGNITSVPPLVPTGTLVVSRLS